MTKDVFKQIKKQNSEAFAQEIRNFDNGIFDVPNIVQLLKYAGTEAKDAKDILDYLEALKDIKIDNVPETRSPFELLDKAGYDAFRADTLEKQNAIGKYFEPNERLCTFKDPERYRKYYIINAVRKDIDDIRRSDFHSPRREDKYGTSVMSIQILKSGGFISIKNRYNHTVTNPDNTYESNPDRIIPRLAPSLNNYFDVDFSSKNVQLPRGYVRMSGNILKYNQEINNLYFGSDFWVKDGKIRHLNNNTQLMMDGMIFNHKKKKFFNPAGVSDTFMDIFLNEIKDKEVQVVKDKDGSKCVMADGIPVAKVKNGQITHLHLSTVTELDKNFLMWNKGLQSASFPNLKKVEPCFLSGNEELKYLYAPQLEEVGYNFLFKNTEMKELSLPRLKKAGKAFLLENTDLSKLDLPMLESVGDNFLYENRGLKELSLPELKAACNGFLLFNNDLERAHLPKLETTWMDFLAHNETMTYLELPSLKLAGHRFMHVNKVLKEFHAPQLAEVKSDFLRCNRELEVLNAPQLATRGPGFLSSHHAVKKYYKNKPTVLSKWREDRDRTRHELRRQASLAS